MSRKGRSLCVGFVLMCLMLPGIPPARSMDLNDRAYKEGVLEKVAGIVEREYVLADKAKGFADAFRTKCVSGAYDGFTDAAEFAAKVTADLIAITRTST